MGLISSIIGAAIGAGAGTLHDQWKEFFYCDAMPKDVLVAKGQKRVGSWSSNRQGNDNIISNGSGIVVADGQCMIIVDQGEVVDICAEPGEFTYDTSSEPSIFTGNLADSVTDTFKEICKRFTYGGETGRDQRVYYFNTKEIMDNKFGTPNPIPFRVVDKRVNFDSEVDLRCSGVYSYRITDPLLFYKRVCGNVQNTFTREQIDQQLKTEFVNALAPALGKIADLEIRPSQLTSHYAELTQAMNEQLSAQWSQGRGITIVSIALNPITLSEEDSQRLKDLQTAAAYANPAYGAGAMAQATAQAMKDAAKNPNGAMNGFVGMNMAAQAGGQAMADLYAQAAQQAPAPAPEAPAAPAPAAPAAETWVCPQCGSVENGNFCSKCGLKKPEAPKKAVCWNCGYEPADQANLPNFCPMCGKPFKQE
ncbi:MAG: SPFH domain-containing protein [Clostridia bacterium]|nr:SPFH domain-containing protein [Clostridia bacterium]